MAFHPRYNPLLTPLTACFFSYFSFTCTDPSSNTRELPPRCRRMFLHESIAPRLQALYPSFYGCTKGLMAFNKFVTSPCTLRTRHVRSIFSICQTRTRSETLFMASNILKRLENVGRVLDEHYGCSVCQLPNGRLNCQMRWPRRSRGLRRNGGQRMRHLRRALQSHPLNLSQICKAPATYNPRTHTTVL
jgi:hypothetical protein